MAHLIRDNPRMPTMNTWGRLISMARKMKAKLEVVGKCAYVCPKLRILARWEKQGIQKDMGVLVKWDNNDAALQATIFFQRYWLTK